MAGWDLVAFYESAARNGLAGIAAIEHDEHIVSGDDLEVRDNGFVAMVQCVTAAIANFDEWRFHRSLDPNWVHSRSAVRDQTGGVDYGRVRFLKYPFNDGDVLNVEADNTNNAQVEAALLALAYGVDPNLTQMPNALPVGARWVLATGATAAVAGAWKKSTTTFSESFDKNKVYKILGMLAYSDTMYACRLQHRSGDMVEHRPGVPGGDTAILCSPLYGYFGSFKGDKPPQLEVLASGTDAAQYAELLIL